MPAAAFLKGFIENKALEKSDLVTIFSILERLLLTQHSYRFEGDG